ncbi:MAG TPA: DUF4232 domain-containing protein [Candidatus Limnocylindria bacterium]|nr:DUF4232 domain-containing protein [Candidatus Limnocylindria bacterium]
MLRFVLAVALLSCAAPTGPSDPGPTRSVAAATGSQAPTFTPTPDPSGLSRCPASQLQAVATGAMGADFFIGAVFLANRGTAPCTLRGNPELVLLANDGSPLDLRMASVSATPRLVVLSVGEIQPGATGVVGFGATAPLQWSNYCEDVLAVRFRLTLPEAGGTVDGTFVDLAGRPASVLPAPRCDDAAGSSTFVVYPIQEPVR